MLDISLLFIVLFGSTYIGLNLIINVVKENKSITKLKNSTLDTNSKTLELLDRYDYVLEFYDITLEKYQRFRFFLLLFLMGIFLANRYLYGYIDKNLLYLIIFSVIFTRPQEKVYGIKTLTGTMLKFTEKLYVKGIDGEIHAMVTWLINIATSEKDSLINPVSIIERLLQVSDKTKRVMQGLLDRFQVGDNKGGTEYFSSKLKTSYAKQFANILNSLDQTNLDDIIGQLKSLQEIYREEQFSKEKISDEQQALKIYIPVILSGLLILINFVVIGVFLPSLAAMNSMQ